MNFSGGGSVTELFQQSSMQFARDGLMVLNSRFAGGGATQTTPRNPASGSNAGYQVPVGKKFVVYMVYGALTAAEVGAPTAGYADNDAGAGGSGTSPTNPVYINGGGNQFNFFNGSTNPVVPIPQGFEVPAGKYLFYGGTGTGAGVVFWVGKEVDA